MKWIDSTWSLLKKINNYFFSKRILRRNHSLCHHMLFLELFILLWCYCLFFICKTFLHNIIFNRNKFQIICWCPALDKHYSLEWLFNGIGDYKRVCCSRQPYTYTYNMQWKEIFDVMVIKHIQILYFSRNFTKKTKFSILVVKNIQSIQCVHVHNIFFFFMVFIKYNKFRTIQGFDSLVLHSCIFSSCCVYDYVISVEYLWFLSFVLYYVYTFFCLIVFDYLQ